MPTKQDILDWLKKTGKSRAYLAMRCGVGSPQVYNWFSKNGKIPPPKLKLIQMLMDEEKRSLPPEPPYDLPDKDQRGKLFIELTPEMQQRIEDEAEILNCRPSAYCTTAVEWCVNTPQGREAVKKIIGEKRDLRQDKERNAG